ncbi:putative zinc protease Rv2782c [Rubritalea halochordaticola]|uniref:Zinc protease Rv2782c n=2 Tax=Rubritalea halochordaticola TaxID=714537 RepID=A0ABP9UVM1_9BACT
MHMHHDQLRGFHVATSEMPYMDSVSVGIYIPVGSRYEELAVNGVAHFLEHMIFKGTSDRSALDLAIAIEGAGGTINAYTTEDQTCLETRGPVELLPEFLEVMADMLWHSTFSIEEIEREREVIAEEIVMYQENPGDHLHDLLSAALWPDHPLGRPITGTEASIQSIHRETLEEFAEEHYSVEGLTLAVAGNVKHEDVLKLADKILPAASTPQKTFEHFDPDRRSAEVQDLPLLHDQREIEQVHLAIAYHTNGRHSSDRHILRMLSFLLGETMSSRLFQELREKRGLCYSISSDYSLYEDTGTFEIHVGLDAQRLDECIDALHMVLTELKNNGFTAAELRQSKRYADGQAKIGLESTHSRMSWMGDSLMSFGKIIDPEEARATLASVTLDEIRALTSKTFMRENISIASIGPHTEANMRQALEKLF